MKRIQCLTFAVLAFASISGGSALAATCQAGKMMCPTTMPIGGYCECTAHGVTADGTVISKPEPSKPQKATAGGCGAHPNAPGCK